MPLYDLSEFLRLSAVLNYNLSASSLNRYNVFTFIVGGKRLDPDDQKNRRAKAVMMEALNFIFNAYAEKRRRLGPLAVLHPLRATALLCRARESLNLIDLLTILFHDILEDIRPQDFAIAAWLPMQEQLYSLMERLDPDAESELARCMLHLTRLEDESYYQYIGRLLTHSRELPQLEQVKLADRLDNTLDMRIDLEDPLEGIDVFNNLFQTLFVGNFRGYKPDVDHPPPAALNGARRLYQLFKNAVLLSLIRQKEPQSKDRPAHILFDAVCEASLKEAQRTLMHLTGHHCKDVAQQRELLLEAMEYCHSGRSDLVTKPDSTHIMDGIFSSYFGNDSAGLRNQKLDLLYQNKPLMIQASVAFIVIFQSFLNDPAYYVHGISSQGMDPR